MAALVTSAEDWIPPTAVIEAGTRASVRYSDPPLAREVAPQFRGLTRTQLPIAPGTQVLRDHVVATFRVRQTYMPGRSRVLLDGQRLDTHQAGVAIDFMVDKATGDAIANWLVTHAEAIGVQFIVWGGNRWSAGQSSARRWAAYEGAVKHRDHPHVELSTAGAAMETPWFAGRARPTAAATHAHSNSPSAPFADKGSFADESGPLVVPLAIGGALIVGAAALAAYSRLRR